MGGSQQGLQGRDVAGRLLIGRPQQAALLLLLCLQRRQPLHAQWQAAKLSMQKRAASEAGMQADACSGTHVRTTNSHRVDHTSPVAVLARLLSRRTMKKSTRPR